MTVAFKDVEMLSNALRGVGCSHSWTPARERKLNAAIAAFSANRHRHASTINVLANALHRVFTKPVSDDGTRERLRRACIEYLNMGGAFAAGPVGLLSGLTPKPWVLVAHFFAVASYAIKKALFPPTFTRMRQAYDLMHVACTIIMPLLASERTTFLSLAPVQWIVNLFFPFRGGRAVGL